VRESEPMSVENHKTPARGKRRAATAAAIALIATIGAAHAQGLKPAPNVLQINSAKIAKPATPTAPPPAPTVAPAPSIGGPTGAPSIGGPTGAPGTPVGPKVGGTPGTTPSGKASSDTATLPQFKDEIEFEPRPPGYKVQFSLEDADLPELIKVMGQLTGKRFIFGGKVRSIKATIYSPQKVTVAEAYQAFLSILETNGLTVIPHGKFLKIIETPGVVTQATPIYGPGTANGPEDRYVTRLHRLSYVTADEVANVLTHFKSRDGDITIYSPGNLLIITDTGTNVKRMMSIIEEIDVAGIGDQVWVEPIHYAGAQEIATKLAEIFDVAKGAAAAPGAKGPGSQSIDARVTKIVPEDRTNSVVIIGTEKAYLRILELIKRLDVPLTGEGEIHVLPLQHADAEELSKTLNDIATKAGATAAPGAPAPKPGGPSASVFEGAIRITADKSTNSLVITSSLRDYASLRNVIDKLDQARRQVYIEAVIMEVSTNHQNKLGVSFHGGDSIDSLGPDGSVILGGSNALGSATFPNLGDPTSLQGLALGVRSNHLLTLAGIGISIPAFGIALQALTTSGDSNVLSTPHIMATDNVPAEINIGENVPLQSSILGGGLPGLGGLPGAAGANPAAGGFGGLGAFGGAFGGISRQNVGTKVKLVPHINDSNEVRLEIDEEISELGAGQGTTLPTIVQRTAKTQVVIQDQQTIVIGGLVRDYISNEETKVPVLGDIPLIGALFKQSTKRNQKRNLLLILTPYVIRDPADLRAIFERKMQERQEFLDRYFVFAGNQGEYQANIDYTRTRGLLEEIRQAYMRVEEKEELDAFGQPKDVKTHEVSKPISELPPNAGATGAGGPTGPTIGGAPTPQPIPLTNPQPPPPQPPPGNPPTILKPGAPVIKSVIIEN
jgi:general secretion pathway protein D